LDKGRTPHNANCAAQVLGVIPRADSTKYSVFKRFLFCCSKTIFDSTVKLLLFHKDCYVALSEVPPNETSQKQQTRVIQRTKDPEFKESFRIAMSNDKMMLSVTLFTRDRVKGQWIPSGFVKLGHSVVDSKAHYQWTQALAHEGEPVKCWHVMEVPSKNH